MQDLSIVIPSFKEDITILTNLKTELESLGAEVIVVDDGSPEPFIQSIKHGTNFGYGAALMTGIKNASRDLVMTFDGDGQHTPQEAVRLYHAYKLMDNVDMVIGMRRIKNEKFIRLLGRKFLNWTASIVCTYWLNDLNSGCRIFKRHIALGYFPILCKKFSFTTSLTVSFLCDGYRVEFFPIKIKERAYGKSRVKVVKDGIVTLWYILKLGLALRTRKIREWKRNLFSRLTGRTGFFR